MSTSHEKLLFLEVSELTVQLVRANGRTIEIFRECLRDHRDDILQAIKEAAPKETSPSVSVVAAISPPRRFAHLGTDEECKRFRTPDAIARELKLPDAFGGGPLALALCRADDGSSVAASSHGRWLAVGAGQDSLAASQSHLAELSLRDTIISPAITNHLGALQTACQLSGAPSSVMAWDLGEADSTLYLVNRKGVLATQACPVGMQQIADAIQGELSLASRAAATKLFLNAFFDFAETGPKVVRRLASGIKAAHHALGGAPSALFCLGLPADNSWFAKDVSALLGMTPWHPSITALSRELGVDFLGNSLAGNLSFNAAGLLQLVGRLAAKSDGWRPAWQMIDIGTRHSAQSPSTAPANATGGKKAAAAESRAGRATAETGTLVGALQTATTSTASTHSILAQATARATALTRTPPPVERPPATQADPPKSTAALALAASTKTQTETKALLSGIATHHQEHANDHKPDAGAVVTAVRRSTAMTVTPKPPGPPEGTPPQATATPVDPQETTSLETKRKASRSRLWIALIALIAVGASTWFTLNIQKENELARTRETEARQRAAEALAKVKENEEAARLETERLRREAEIERERAVAAVKLRTEEEVLQRVEAERRANAPGILVVRTEPSGAYVSIDGALPQATPISINSLSIGTHHLSISLPGFDTTTRTVEIKRDQTTDLGLIELTRQIGGLEIISEPAGLAFELRQASEKPDSPPMRTGTTPATLGELIVGEYTVTLLRPGWNPVTSTAKVSSLSTTQVVPLFPTARLMITSTPSGAAVMRNEELLGTTPLQLSELKPGDYVFELSIPEHDSSIVKTRLSAGADAEVTASLDPFDRILKMSEIAQAPVAIKTVTPDFVARGIQDLGEAVVSCVIDRNGVPTSLNLEKASSEDFGKACIAALAKWRFKPATTKTGRTANVKVSVPFTLSGR
ncbi:MAG: TonB family protein [Opitutaceae bacterium]|nr:TonB family protein [Opitutaceae bacterium]